MVSGLSSLTMVNNVHIDVTGQVLRFTGYNALGFAVADAHTNGFLGGFVIRKFDKGSVMWKGTISPWV